MKNWIFLFLCNILLINCNNKVKVTSITTLQLKELLQKDTIQLLDVRTPIEVAQGTIETAVAINYFDTDFSKKATLKLDKERPLYVYCRSGKRSTRAAKILKEKGFKVYNVKGGYNKWKTEN